jgi:aminopeptidase-like protein
MADGEHTIFDIIEKSNIPFGFGLSYLKKMEKLDLIKLIEQ